VLTQALEASLEDYPAKRARVGPGPGDQSETDHAEDGDDRPADVILCDFGNHKFQYTLHTVL
jgi:hypothetical protein